MDVKLGELYEMGPETEPRTVKVISTECPIHSFPIVAMNIRSGSLSLHTTEGAYQVKPGSVWDLRPVVQRFDETRYVMVCKRGDGSPYIDFFRTEEYAKDQKDFLDEKEPKVLHSDILPVNFKGTFNTK